jgi:TRAP-type transport system small permease protein
MQTVLDYYYRLLRVLLTSLMALLIVPVSLQILSRYTGLIPRYIWTEEVARFCFIWIIMIGSMIAVRDGVHFDVDVLPRPRTNRGRGLSLMVVHGAMMLMALVFSWYGIGFAEFGYIQTSELSGINMLSIYVSFPMAGFTWVLFLLEKFVEDVSILREPQS